MSFLNEKEPNLGRGTIPKGTNDGDDIFIMDKLEFLGQLKVRSKILKVLMENFEMKKMWVIMEKKKD